MRVHNISSVVLSCLLLISCTSLPEHRDIKFNDITQIAYDEYEGNGQHKAFAIGQSGDNQVFGTSYEWATGHKAAEKAMSECRKSYEARIGGRDNCVLYSVNSRLCEQQVDCVPSPKHGGEKLGDLAKEAFQEYQGYGRHRAFAIGGSDDYQVWGFSSGLMTELMAVDAALNECRIVFKADIGGPDNCVLYALDNRLCDGLCLY